MERNQGQEIAPTANINEQDQKSSSRLELAQISWVVPSIYTPIKFLGNAPGIAGLPQPENIRAQDLGITCYGQAIPGDRLTTETFTGSGFIDLIQPLFGQSMFHDYLASYPAGGPHHIAFRLPVSEFYRINGDLRDPCFVASARWTTS